MSLSRNTIWNLAGAGLPLLIGAATIPWLMSRLGVERFGILTLLWAIIGYFSLFDFGLGRALTQQVSASLGEGHEAQIPGLVRSGIKFTFATGVLGALLLVASAHPLGYSILNVSASLQKETFVSLLIAAIGIPLATVSAGLRGVVEGYERFLASNVARIFLGVSIFAFPVFGVLLSGPSLVAVTIWLIISRFASMVLFWYFVGRLPYHRLPVLPREAGATRKLLSFGVWMALSNLISPLLVNADRFVISHLLGAAVVAFYTVPFEFLVRLLILPGAIGSTLLPRMARDHQQDPAKSHALFRQGLTITFLVMGGLALLCCVIAYPLMNHFLAPGFAARSIWVVLILSVGVVVNGGAYMPYTALHSMKVARPVGILHSAELVIYLPLLVGCVYLMGLEGAAVAWTLRAFLDCLGLFYLYRRATLDAV
jgi:O-antigen/teichoic acid export membrane protein